MDAAFDRYKPLLQDGGRLLLLVIDGLGGYPEADRGSELEEARTPNLDGLAAAGIVGLTEPAGAGITVGSGPGHLALFGYDPWSYDLGRGVLAAVGVEFDLQPGDVAARGNFAFLDHEGRITDRRAGRISDDEAGPLVKRLAQRVEVEGVEVHLRHVSEHRVLVVLRGEGLDGRVADTDPQRTGVMQKDPVAKHPDAQRSVQVIGQLDQAFRDALTDEGPDTVLLRGFDSLQELPDFGDRTGLRAAAIASYPMYRGVASLIGMDVLGPPTTFAQQIELAKAQSANYDYLFVHYKYADAAGHDGDRAAKIQALESVDADLPELLGAVGADVIAVSGDHASPAALAGHSWHPVPTLLNGGSAGVDDAQTFGERSCAGGLFGRRPTQELLPLMLASAGRLAKYGA